MNGKMPFFPPLHILGGEGGDRVEEREERPLEEFSYICYFKAETGESPSIVHGNTLSLPTGGGARGPSRTACSGL